MNTKSIWLIAMVFGLIAAVMMYVMVVEGNNKPVQPASNTVSKEEKEPVQAEDKVEEKKVNEMIPVSKGKRGITIGVTDVQGVAGLVSPGSYVDVIAVMEGPEEKDEKQHDSATLLLQHVKILAIGHAADDEETMKKYLMVTIEATPKEGLILGFSTRYELYLMLRQDGDEKIEPNDTHIHEDELHKGVFK